MPLSSLKSESGLTLTELIVALGLSSLLLILVVTGSLFVKRYVSNWSNRDKIAEELAFVRTEIVPRLENSRTFRTAEDSLIFSFADGREVLYWLDGGGLYRDSTLLTRSGLSLDSLVVTKFDLQNDTNMTTFERAGAPSGLYSLTIAVSDKKGNASSLKTTVKNKYEFLKYHQEQ